MNIHAKPPAEPQDAPLYVPTDVTPEKLFQAIGRLRKEARDEIDRLLNFLDETDGHMEREPDDDEPSLGWPERITAGQFGSPGGTDDREGEPEHDEDGDPAEPSLGSLGLTDQRDWSMGDRRDLEDEHDGAEPSEDDEPSLGSFEGLTMDQEVSFLVGGAGMGVSTDAELDEAEQSGIGDQDGVDEQAPFRDWQNIGMV
jgi:hypothetical protein